MYLILGIDPGTTKGIAALDFQGNVVGLHSSKEMGLDSVLKHIIGLGTASVVATDVSPAPEFVLKVAASLGATAYVPEESTKVLDKMEATKGYRADDAHQRDALAAALNAYGSYKNKFIKIDSLNLGVDGDEVKHLVIQGKSISDAHKEILSWGEEQKTEEPRQTGHTEQREQTEEEKRRRMLEKQNHIQRKQLIAKDEEITNLKESIARLKTEYTVGLKKDSEIQKKEYSIRDLKNAMYELRKSSDKFEELKKTWQKGIAESIYPVGIYPQKKRGYVLLKQRITDDDVDDLKGAHFVYTDLEENRRMLRGRRIKTADTRHVKEIDGCYYICSEDVEKTEKDIKESNAPPVQIDNLIESYRKDRRLKY